MNLGAWLFIGFGILIGGIVYLIFKFEKKRCEKIKQFCQRRGYQYEISSNQTPNCSLFQVGHSKKKYNIINLKLENKEIKVYDYKYTQGYGKNKSTPQYIISEFKLKETIPKFRLIKENIFHKIGGKLGFDDIDFEMYPEFSKQFKLTGDPNLKSYFKESLIKFFETRGVKNETFESTGSEIICYERGKLKEKMLSTHITEIERIFNAFDKNNKN